MGSLSPPISIPAEFESQLTPTSPLDTRSDAAILAPLEHFQPVTSEKNIWAFWHSGVSGLPGWCRRNIVDWHRINGPAWTVRVLDSDPASPNFFLKYVGADLFPAAVAGGDMTGAFSRQHTADFVRSATIYTHGGVFMDVGCLLVRRLERICWDKLADETQPWRVGIASMFNPGLANHFVACRKGDPFIRRWHDLMLHMWIDRTESTGTVLGNPLLNFLPEYNMKHAGEAMGALGWDFTDIVAAQEYIGQILAWERLCFLDKEDEEGFNCAEYWVKHVLAWDAVAEHWSAELLVHQKGPHPRIMELLAVRRDSDPNSEDYRAAYNMTWHILTSSSMQKVTSARGLTDTPHLGVLWEMPENADKDRAEGTFAELLRYGSVHFEQKRKEILYVPARPVETPLKKGLLEP